MCHFAKELSGGAVIVMGEKKEKKEKRHKHKKVMLSKTQSTEHCPYMQGPSDHQVASGQHISQQKSMRAHMDCTFAFLSIPGWMLACSQAFILP